MDRVSFAYFSTCHQWHRVQPFNSTLILEVFMGCQLHVGPCPLNVVHITKKLTNGTDKIWNSCEIDKSLYQAVYGSVPKSRKPVSDLGYQQKIDLINGLGGYHGKSAIWRGLNGISCLQWGNSHLLIQHLLLSAHFLPGWSWCKNEKAPSLTWRELSMGKCTPK